MIPVQEKPSPSFIRSLYTLPVAFDDQKYGSALDIKITGALFFDHIKDDVKYRSVNLTDSEGHVFTMMWVQEADYEPRNTP